MVELVQHHHPDQQERHVDVVALEAWLRVRAGPLLPAAGDSESRRLYRGRHEGEERQEPAEQAEQEGVGRQDGGQAARVSQVGERGGEAEQAHDRHGQQRPQNERRDGDGPALDGEHGYDLAGSRAPAPKQGDLGLAVLHGQVRQNGHVVEDDHRYQREDHEHGQLAEEEPLAVLAQRIVQLGRLAVSPERRAEHPVHVDDIAEGELGVVGGQTIAVDHEQPGVHAGHPSRRGPQDFHEGPLRDVEGRGAKGRARRGVQEVPFHAPQSVVGVVALEDPADQYGDVPEFLSPRRHGDQPVAGGDAEQLGGVRRDDGLHLEDVVPDSRPGLSGGLAGHDCRVVVEAGSEREIGPRVVLAGVRLVAGMHQEEGLGLADAQPVRNRPADARVGFPSSDGVDPLVLFVRNRAAFGPLQDVQLLVAALAQDVVQGKVAQGVEVDHSAGHDGRRENHAQDHGRQQLPVGEALLGDELPSCEESVHRRPSLLLVRRRRSRPGAFR